MPQNPRRLTTLDWPALVGEARRRRKAEGLTQRAHAALAGVSIPTILAFDRCETTLTLAKAFDILRVVGLLEERDAEGSQERFLREAYERWQALTEKLPTDSPARFPHGWYRFDYWLEGDLKPVNLNAFEANMRQLSPHQANWPLFIALTRPELAPRAVDGLLECWIPPETDKPIERMVSDDPAHCDFWRASPNGRLFLMRGYEEDGQETFPPGTLFDAAWPVRRMGEALLHAEKLAGLMRASDDAKITVHFRALYTGLNGRVIKAWSNPHNSLFTEGYATRSDEVLVETSVPAINITARLSDVLLPMVAAIFERFGVVGLSTAAVRGEVDRLLRSRV